MNWHFWWIMMKGFKVIETRGNSTFRPPLTRTLTNNRGHVGSTDANERMPEPWGTFDDNSSSAKMLPVKMFPAQVIISVVTSKGGLLQILAGAVKQRDGDKGRQRHGGHLT